MLNKKKNKPSDLEENFDDLAQYLCDENIRTLEEANRLHAQNNDLIKEELEFKKKTRDRVNISLNEYLSLVESKNNLIKENAILKGAFDKIHLNNFDFKTVEEQVIYDPMENKDVLTIRLTYNHKDGMEYGYNKK